MKSGNIENFKHLSQFKDTKDFNNQIEKWMIDIKYEFTKSELIALKRLIRFACKYAGISNAKLQTLVEATHKDAVGVSRSTFERMLRKAKACGVVTVHNTFCGSNQRHNVYVFNRYQSLNIIESETPTNEVLKAIDVPNQETSQDKTSSNINIRKDNVIKGIPVDFQDLVKCYYSSTQVIELWKCIKNSTRYLLYMDEQQKVNLGIRAFKQMICNIKMGYNIKNIFGYYYAIINNFLDDEHMKIVRGA
ncbi:hypothetical protein [Priestia megaterium]|uniref:hypothetical protein n=1 Tax=Priestia megaterium TaxID=1404 RepID=UPI002E1D4FB1|nr:hypothetical protein [Priestia megaterium]